MDDSKYEELKALFPVGTKIINVNGTIDSFEAQLRCQCKDKEDFCLYWLKQYEDLNKLTFHVGVTRPRTGKTVLYKAIYRCQHNTYPKSHKQVKTAHKKNTDCPAVLRITIKSSVGNRHIRSNDNLRAEYPTLITVVHKHNHRIMAAEALKYRDISEMTKIKLIDMFRSHHPPARALEILKQDMLEEYGDEYYNISADSSVCPNIQTVYQLYYTVFKEQYGEEKLNIRDILKEIAERVLPKTHIKYQVLNENDFVLAAVPALMQRVHDLKVSGQTVFIDSSGNMDRFNCRVFLLLSDSSVGGLPLGFLMTSSESEDAITCGLRLIKEILPSSPFGGSTTGEPEVFMSDDCQAQINAIRNTFPHSRVFLCTFHILQSVWRWLLKSSHNINSSDRQNIFQLFKKTVYSANQEEFQNRCTEVLNDLTVMKYPNFLSYIKGLFEKHMMWAHCFRNLNRGINTNNTVENAMKVMKDKVLNRTRAYNPVQLFKFIEEELCNYYSCKIGDIINGKYNGHQHLRYFPKIDKLKDLEIIEKEKGLFSVVNKVMKTEYTVNIELEICSCPIGKSGAPCKHQHVVYLTMSKSGSNIIPLTSDSRAYYHWIAYGTKVSEDWYGNLVASEKQEQEVNNEHIIMGSALEHMSENSMQEEISITENQANVVEIPDWCFLKQRFNDLFEKWETKNSVAHYAALRKMVSYLENCKTKCKYIGSSLFWKTFQGKKICYTDSCPANFSFTKEIALRRKKMCAKWKTY